MSQATASGADRILGQWRTLAATTAARYGLDPWIVLGMIAQESNGNPYAWRPEPGFLAKYGDNIPNSLSRVQDAAAALRYRQWWKNDPMVFATSMGLLQTMVIVAIEHGTPLEFPTSLCNPAISLDAGCRKLKACADKVGDSPTAVRDMLQRYNGGGAPDYHAEVRAWAAAMLQASKG